MTSDLDLAVTAAKEAGALIRRRYGRPARPAGKGRNDFTTPTDQDAERLIIARLGKTGYSIFGEETGLSRGAADKTWVIDPLDGTMNFIKGLPFMAVSIALMEKGDLKLGVVYDPLRDECYSAEAGAGATLDGARLKVRSGTQQDPSGPLVLVEHGHGAAAKRDFAGMLSALVKSRNLTIQRQGSTALMLCYVARGAADAFAACGDQLYDHAAGLVIAREAGAVLSDWRGGPLDPKGKHILVTTPSIHSAMVSRLRHLSRP